MKLTDKRFWISWGALLVLMVGRCLSEGWREDTTLLGGAYALSLLSTYLCHRIRERIAFGNLIVMIVYNAILSYDLAFHSQYGAGQTWCFFALLLNAVHSIALLAFVIANTIKRKKLATGR